MNKKNKAKVLAMANRLVKPNGTVTTLEIKNELRQKFPDQKWFQAEISNVMNEFNIDEKCTYTDNGTYRTYSMIKTAPVKSTKQSKKKQQIFSTSCEKDIVKIGRAAALKIMESAGGRFFTAVFETKKNPSRIINCKRVAIQPYKELGYVLVREGKAAKKNPEKALRNINIQTLKELRFGQKIYKIYR